MKNLISNTVEGVHKVDRDKKSYNFWKIRSHSHNYNYADTLESQSFPSIIFEGLIILW